MTPSEDMPKRLNVTNEAANQFELEQAVEQMKRNIQAWRDYIEIDAQLRAEKFRQLKKNGFNDAQALELCKGALLGLTGKQ